MTGLRITCESRGCRRLAVVQLRDLTDGWTTYRCDAHASRSDRYAVNERLRPVCQWCGQAMPVPAREQGGGRTKKFCSGKCRTAAHRASADLASR